jgi:hypothetical protein
MQPAVAPSYITERMLERKVAVDLREAYTRGRI